MQFLLGSKMQPLVTQNQDLVEELFLQTQSYIAHFFEKLNLDAVRSVVEMLLCCEGTLFLSGVGKSGIVAKKIAATLSSTGTPAIFLIPLREYTVTWELFRGMMWLSPSQKAETPMNSTS